MILRNCCASDETCGEGEVFHLLCERSEEMAGLDGMSWI